MAQSHAAAPAPDATFEVLFAATNLGMAVMSLDGAIERSNGAFCDLTGRSPRELRGLQLAQLVHPADEPEQRAQIERLLDGELTATTFSQRLRRADGAATPVRVVLAVTRDADGRPGSFVAQIEDLGERERLQEQVRFEAEHDALTGVYNRAAFGAILDRQLKLARRYERECVLALLDVDGFHAVNETHGPVVGDEVLRAVASALRGRLRESDVIARLGSDEFGLLIAEVDGAEGEHIVGEVLRAIAEHGPSIGDHEVRVRASAGLSRVGAGGALTAEEAFTAADVALMAAKEEGGGRALLYDARVRAAHAGERLRRSWAEKIRTALDEGSFVLDCQPIVEVATGDAISYELFLRMLDEDGTVVRPNGFLHLAERYGMMPAIDEWVIAQAIAIASERERAGEPVTLAVNVSAEAVCNPGVLAATVERLMAEPGIGGRLVFELTERSTSADADRAARFMARLRELGCRFALDDFCSGYGSFAQLKRLPFDFVKLDGEFTRGLPGSPADRAIVQALQSVARTLGARAIAECVEDEEILDAIRGFGIELAQGLHVGRPRRVADVFGLAAAGR